MQEIGKRTYARLLPYEAEVWQSGFAWCGVPQALEGVLRARGAARVTVPAASAGAAVASLRGMAGVSPLLVALRHLPPAAAATGVRNLHRMAPPHCEGDLLARAAHGARRAVLLLLGPETVGWGLSSGRLRDAFRSLDEEALGAQTTGAVPARVAIARMRTDGTAFADVLFAHAGLAAGAGLDAYGHRLRQAVGRLAGAIGGIPDAIFLGGDRALTEYAEQALSDLAPVAQTGVAWGMAAWAAAQEKG